MILKDASEKFEASFLVQNCKTEMTHAAGNFPGIKRAAVPLPVTAGRPQPLCSGTPPFLRLPRRSPAFFIIPETP